MGGCPLRVGKENLVRKIWDVSIPGQRIETSSTILGSNGHIPHRQDQVHLRSEFSGPIRLVLCRAK